MKSTSTFAPLRHYVFALILLGSFLSNLGNAIQSVGAAWLLTETGQPADIVALVQTAINLPIMLLALVSQQRFGRNRRQGHQVVGGGIVRSLAAGQDEADRESLIVAAGMDFARKAAA